MNQRIQILNKWLEYDSLSFPYQMLDIRIESSRFCHHADLSHLKFRFVSLLYLITTDNNLIICTVSYQLTDTTRVWAACTCTVYSASYQAVACCILSPVITSRCQYNFYPNTFFSFLHSKQSTDTRGPLIIN